MGKYSKIEWTHHTFNPWWGCIKVSEACKHCYAESWARRVGADVWGPKAGRRFFSEQHWKQPLSWNREAQDLGVRYRVFCASMADVFEDRPELNQYRRKLFELIESTNHLDWLLLTKRPQNINRLVTWANEWPSNVWVGTTIENQKRADELIPYLEQIPSSIRFVSCEPLLESLDLSQWLGKVINWVIAGGESGGKARPSHPDWFRGLRDQCFASNVPFHFKQWGSWAPVNGTAVSGKKIFAFDDGAMVVRLNKATSGRVLDGIFWDGVPSLCPKSS